jgi:hypothetical protein
MHGMPTNKHLVSHFISQLVGGLAGSVGWSLCMQIAANQTLTAVIYNSLIGCIFRRCFINYQSTRQCDVH